VQKNNGNDPPLLAGSLTVHSVLG